MVQGGGSMGLLWTYGLTMSCPGTEGAGGGGGSGYIEVSNMPFGRLPGEHQRTLPCTRCRGVSGHWAWLQQVQWR